MMNSTLQQTTLSNGSGCSSNGKDDIKRIFVTHVDNVGPYLKISGQVNLTAKALLPAKVQEWLPTCFAINPSWQVARQLALLAPGEMCLYKRGNGANIEFLRARIINIPPQEAHSQPLKQSALHVEVEFIDYGYTSMVGSFELLFPQQSNDLLIIPALCADYIMLGICTEWKKSDLLEISRMIANQSVEYSVQMDFNEYKFITMKWKGFNFAEFLIHQKKIGAPIANNLLRDHFVKILKQQQRQQQAHTIATGATAVTGVGDVVMTNIKNNNNNINNNNFYSNNNKTTIPMDKLITAGSITTGGVGTNQIVSSRSYVSTINMHPEMCANQLRSTHPLAPTSIGDGGDASPLLSPRSLSNRLQQAQLRGGYTMQNMPTYPVQYRMPQHTASNWRTPVQAAENQFLYNGSVLYNHAQPIILVAPSVQPNYYQPTNFQHLQRTRELTPAPPPAAPSVSSPRRTTSAAFTSNNLKIGKTYDVCVSYVENGPCLFSVQLMSAQAELTEMMNRMESVQLKPFVENPIVGRACIARYSEDGQLYRALITSVQPTACKVAYIDYGNAELVMLQNLYEIPEEFLTPKAYAIRFTLSGYKELEPIDESLKKAFKDLVIYKNFKLTVMPLEGPPLVQYCKLFMQDNNILDFLKQIQNCRLVYAKAEALQNNDIVEIRYIDSPKHFYVQKVSNIAKFEELMDNMFLYYNKNQVVPTQLSLGSPCIVKYENEWYRAEVMRDDDTAIIVRHVDFGYEQKVTRNLLSTIAEKHLQLPRQAVQCCLKGYENNELIKELATTQFEMLAEESNRKRRSFTVKVFRIQPDGVNLVNLCTQDLNVMKKLYKLSMPFEQYLTLEKEEFNGHSQGRSGHLKAIENSPKSPSIASSSSVPSLTSHKKVNNFLNSTVLPFDDSSQQVQKHLQRQLQQSQRRNTSKSSQNSYANDYDKHSSASSMDNRDSRSSSSEHKQSKRPQYQQLQQQQQQHQYGRNLQPNIQSPHFSPHNSFDKRSVTSGSSTNSYNKSRIGSGASGSENTPIPRFQNKKPQDINNRQLSKRPSTPPQHKRPQRSQNAPQGYSQPPPQKIVSLLNYSGPSEGSITIKVHQNVEEYMPLDQPFPFEHLETPAREEVVICWWVSPHQFYTHLKKRSLAFECFMGELQQFYKKKPLQQLQLKVGSYVVARHRKENVLHRARILACNQMLRKYKVFFVDLGNQFTVTSEDIWQVEKRFALFPCMAYLCSFNGVVSNFEHLYIIERMGNYLPSGAALICEYTERNQEMYYVNVNVQKVSLKETLKAEGLITEVCPELNLDLLAGQQIRAKISSIKDMLNFKIQIEGCEDNIKLLSSYDDIRYVKSNPDIAQKFKDFYEGKSCVVNIKEVNENKVLLLRTLIPLLKEDIPSYICTYPIILNTFDAKVVYVASSYRVYAHLKAALPKIDKLLDEMFEYYEHSGIPLQSLELEQICAVNSKDTNWYRARIVASPKNSTDLYEVYYIDYGNKEKVDKSKLKHLEERFYKDSSAFAIEINLPLRPLSDQTHKNKTKKQNDGTNADISVINALMELTLNSEFAVQALQVHKNHLIADIKAADKSVVDMLKEVQLVKGKDIDYMHKLLDKEQPNVLEYIEMVDLTGDDEEEVERKSSHKNKNVLSPKKKKPQKTDEKAEKIGKAATDIKKSEAVSASTSPQPPNVPSVPLAQIITEKKEIPEFIPKSKLQPTPKQEPEPEPEIEIETAPEPVAVEPVDPYADMEHAVLSHCDNPAQFFVHPIEKLEELRKLQENLQIVASSLPPLMRVINGAYCISLYSVDKQWYRAMIMDAELMVLQFIDYGNTDCVSDTTDIKEMSVFPDIEPLCMPCALPIKPKNTADWVDAANAIFNDSYAKTLNFEYITHGDNQKRSFINLHIDGVNVAEKLIEDGFAKPLEQVTSGEYCYISHVNGLRDFYIQYEKESKALELIEIYLEKNDTLQLLQKFEPSKIVAACFPEDGRWYRAKLLNEVPNEGYEVLFIDFGNTSITPDCREISDDMVKVPALSKKCALELPTDCPAWSDEAEKKFGEIAALGETVFTVELREPASDYAIVHLYIDGHNISDDLEPLCEHTSIEVDLNNSFVASTIATSVYESGTLYEGMVTHLNSPFDFYVQFSKDAIRLEDLTHTLNTLTMEALEQPEVGQLCAAVFTEDKTLYRARILDIVSATDKKYRVIFIDFGNESIVTDVRVLPHDLQQLKEFSKHCQLENACRFAALLDVACEAFTIFVTNCEGLVKIEILDEEDEPAVVKIYSATNEENFFEKLNSILDSSESSAASVVKTCLISCGVSPKHFYIQLTADLPRIEQISKTLDKSKAEQMLTISGAAVGRVCCAFSTEDDCYYRGRVETVLEGDAGYDIFLIDYGNHVVSTELHDLPLEVLSIPPLALKCKLNEIPNAADKVLEDNFAALLEEHFGETYTIDVQQEVVENSEHTVKLEVNYKDLATELAKAVDNNAQELAAFSPLPTLHNCNLIHVNSPGSFYIQLADDIPAIEKVTDKLLDAETELEHLKSLEVGAICAALYNDAYYRAEIVEIFEDGKCEVHFIDFGNNSITDQLLILPESIVDIERGSKHCALDGSFNTAEACDLFLELVGSRFTETFQLEFLKTDAEPNICRLFYQEKNMATELKQQLLKRSQINKQPSIDSTSKENGVAVNGEGATVETKDLVDDSGADDVTEVYAVVVNDGGAGDGDKVI